MLQGLTGTKQGKEVGWSLVGTREDVVRSGRRHRLNVMVARTVDMIPNPWEWYRGMYKRVRQEPLELRLSVDNFLKNKRKIYFGEVFEKKGERNFLKLRLDGEGNERVVQGNE